MRRKSRRGGQGFTLIETIVGFSMILTVVLGVIMKITLSIKE